MARVKLPPGPVCLPHTTTENVTYFVILTFMIPKETSSASVVYALDKLLGGKDKQMGEGRENGYVRGSC
jgi:hypothetical protein